jgi:hypothetical protein
MIRYTADLGKCFCGAKLFTCHTHVYMKVSLCGIPSCCDDAANRAMIQVVSTIILVSGDTCRASSLLYCFLAYFSYCQGLG